MKKILLLIALSSFIYAYDSCTYNNINKYSINNEHWILLGQFDEDSWHACKNMTSIKVSSIESFVVYDNFIIFKTHSGELFRLKNYDFSKFNEVLKGN